MTKGELTMTTWRIPEEITEIAKTFVRAYIPPGTTEIVILIVLQVLVIGHSMAAQV